MTAPYNEKTKQYLLKFALNAYFGEEDFLVTTCNKLAYQTIKSWPYWPHFALNIFGPKSSGKSHLSHIWINEVEKGHASIADGVEVVSRGDFNHDEVVAKIAECVSRFAMMSKEQVRQSRRKASLLSRKALWQRFFSDYLTAYEVALSVRDKRVQRQ